MKNMNASMPLEWLTDAPFHFWSFLCGRVLARAIRVGDAAKIAGYCGKSEALDEAQAEFAESYADQTELDHASAASDQARASKSSEEIKKSAESTPQIHRRRPAACAARSVMNRPEQHREYPSEVNMSSLTSVS
jgi:hypothetical protein